MGKRAGGAKIEKWTKRQKVTATVQRLIVTLHTRVSVIIYNIYTTETQSTAFFFVV